MPGQARGMLLVWMDMAPDHQDDFHAWYNRDHLPERIALPGFRTGRRWQAVKGAPEFMAAYELDDPAATAAPEYRERLEHPTAWTRRVMPHFRNTLRGVCAITARVGMGSGGFAATLRLAPPAAQREGLRLWLTAEGLPALMKLSGIVGALLVEAVPEGAPRTPTAEQKLRAEPDGNLDWALLIEGMSALEAEGAAHSLVRHSAAAQGGAPLQAEQGVYRFLCGVVPPAGP